MSEYPFKGRDPLYSGTHQGVRWCIYQAPLNSVLNGYAYIPDDVLIDVDTLDVHGGITYGNGECTGWIGFDTAHTGDAWDVTDLRQRVGVHITPAGEAWQKQEREMHRGSKWERVWTVPALQAECERLCEQIVEKVTENAS
jgi:hypothetical protein